VPEAVGGEVAEEALHHVQPRRAGVREADVESWMTLQPALYGRMFVSGVVVQDQI
jgi:hypothetical protein